MAVLSGIGRKVRDSKLNRVAIVVLFATVVLSGVGCRLNAAPRDRQASGGAASSETPQASAPEWQIAAGGHLEFDVASIKENKGDLAGPRRTNIPLGPNDAFNPTGGRFSTANYPIRQYIVFAYKLLGYQADVLDKELPDWTKTKGYFD